MSIVRYINKKTGVISVYESTSYYDPVHNQSRPKRKYLGIETPSGEFIPSSGVPGRKKKTKPSSAENTDSKDIQSDSGSTGPSGASASVGSSATSSYQPASPEGDKGRLSKGISLSQKQLQAAYELKHSEVERLKAQNKALRAENTRLQKAIKSISQIADSVAPDPVSPTADEADSQQ